MTKKISGRCEICGAIEYLSMLAKQMVCQYCATHICNTMEHIEEQWIKMHRDRFDTYDKNKQKEINDQLILMGYEPIEVTNQTQGEL